MIEEVWSEAVHDLRSHEGLRILYQAAVNEFEILRSLVSLPSTVSLACIITLFISTDCLGLPSLLKQRQGCKVIWHIEEMASYHWKEHLAC
jgi:hypothetical protein